MSSRRGLCQRRGAVYNSDMSLLQAEVERRGTQIFDLVDRHPESIFSKAGFYQRMMEFSMRDEHFKVQMFRFVDVLASLRRGSDIVQHLDEYFADMRNGYARLIRRTRLRISRRSSARFYAARRSWARSSISTWKATRTKTRPLNFFECFSPNRNFAIGRMPASSFRLTCATRKRICLT